MKIKIQIKKLLVLGAILFLVMQTVVIFAYADEEGGAFEKASTNLVGGGILQQTQHPSEAENADQALSQVASSELLDEGSESLDLSEEQSASQIEQANQQKEDGSELTDKEQPQETETPKQSASSYPLHSGIIATYFWIGEGESDDNGGISNVPSAWDENWVKHFGGVDDPKKRDGYFPSKFTPKENPFYFALPYNDFGSDGDRRSDVNKVIPWASSEKWKDSESMCKNQWIKIIKGGKVAYAQWQDVGPFEEKDTSYVFGTSKPKNKENSKAGLDISPAVRDYLDLSDVDKVDWQFIEENNVPSGPWKKIITRSQVDWN